MDWDSSVSLGGSDWDDDDGERPEAPERTGQSLKEYLLWQLELARLSARDAAIGAAIIDSLNDDGYLTESLEDIRGALADSDASPEPDEMDAMLHRVQSFEPPGIAARDLKECLLLQLRQDSAPDPARHLAMTLVNGHLEALATRDYAPLCRSLGVERGLLDAAVATILGLHPRPGTVIAGAPVDYVIPDVLVSRKSGGMAGGAQPRGGAAGADQRPLRRRLAARRQRQRHGAPAARGPLAGAQHPHAQRDLAPCGAQHRELAKARSWSAARKPCGPCS